MANAPMKKTKKAESKKPAGGKKPALKKPTKLSDKDIEKVSGGTKRTGTNDDSI